MPNLIIGSRGSKLALWQSNWIKQELERLHQGLVVAIEIIKTTGDKMQEVSLAGLAGAGKGVFTKEIEEALLNRSVDLAVHSLKDLPTVLPDGLHIAAITERVDVRDALICSAKLHGTVKAIRDLPQGARVGTSSLRRRAQLLHQRPDLEVLELRGNVDTRLRKLDEGQYDAIILASAGLIRLGFADRISARIDPAEMLTAVSQGALGIESRVNDDRTNLLLESLNHWPTRFATEAERAVLRELGGGCAVPIAALGIVNANNQLRLEGLVADVEGRELIRLHAEGSAHQAEELGAQLAEALVQAGARDLLNRVGSEQKTAIEITEQTERKTGGTEPRLENEARKQEVISSVPFVPSSSSNRSEEASPSVKVVTPEQPLAGRKVIVTRSPKQSSEMVRFLEKLGAEVIACPTIEIKAPTSWEQMDSALEKLSWFDWLVFTSSNGIEYFLRRLDETGHARAELMAHKVCAVGRKTAERLRAENIAVTVMPERFTAEALIEEFIKRFGVSQRLRGSKMLLPASNITLDVIRPAMEKIGVYVEVVEAYQTVLPSSSSREVMELIQDSHADYIIFTSPSTVANLAAILETDHLTPQLADCRVACIGPVTAEAAELHGLDVHIQPKEHTAEAVVRALALDSLKLREAEVGAS